MLLSIRTTVAALMLVGILGAQASANLIFNVTLSGLQEVPANASPGAGSAIANFDQVTGAMSISGSYSGMLGNVTAAHLHGFTASGSNAGVVFPLTVTGGTSGTFSGNGVIAQIDIQRVLDGLSYINVHSSSFPGGEIRGQLVNPVPEPSAGLLTMVFGCTTLVARHRRLFSR